MTCKPRKRGQSKSHVANGNEDAVQPSRAAARHCPTENGQARSYPPVPGPSPGIRPRPGSGIPSGTRRATHAHIRLRANTDRKKRDHAFNHSHTGATPLANAVLLAYDAAAVGSAHVAGLHGKAAQKLNTPPCRYLHGGGP